MKILNLSVSKTILRMIKNFIDETDIYTLAFMPPLLGFGGYLILVLILGVVFKRTLSESFLYIGAGIAFLITSVSGIAEIYKKEMPGSFGKIIKGNFAVISGIIIVIFMGCGGGLILLYGLARLFKVP